MTYVFDIEGVLIELGRIRIQLVPDLASGLLVVKWLPQVHIIDAVIEEDQIEPDELRHPLVVRVELRMDLVLHEVARSWPKRQLLQPGEDAIEERRLEVVLTVHNPSCAIRTQLTSSTLGETKKACSANGWASLLPIAPVILDEDGLLVAV